METKAHLCFLKKVGGGAVGVFMEPRGQWTEKVWEPLLYSIMCRSRTTRKFHPNQADVESTDRSLFMPLSKG